MNSATQQLLESLGDSSMLSIAWQGGDLLIAFALAGTPARSVSFRFEWVTCLKINFDYGDYFTEPFMFGSHVKKTEGGWSILFEFGGQPDGGMSFECNDVVDVSVADLPD